jgi:hypothetical protein
MALPCGHAWLDLQRYVLQACAQLGSAYDSVAAAVRSEVRSLLAEMPELASAMLTDDTPAANPETRSFLAALEQPRNEAMPEGAMSVPEIAPSGIASQAQEQRDVFELAIEAARSGQAAEAIGIMGRAIEGETSGRGRFQRRLQFAQICLSLKKDNLARTILQDLVGEVQQRALNQWEPAAIVVQPFVLLLQCMDRLGVDGTERRNVYDQLSRIDPAQAARLS